MGYGRSGSTLLDLILGQSESIESTGELHCYFDDISRGTSFGPFWDTVYSALQHDIPDCDFNKAFRHQRIIENGWRWPLVSFNLIPARIVNSYRQYMRALFAAIGKSSGKSYILDSSKSTRLSAGRPYTLFRLCGFEVKAIHVIRDVRAVIFSQLRGSNRKLAKGDTSRPHFIALRTVMNWSIANLQAAIISRMLPPNSTIVIRYEDLAAHPVAVLQELEPFLGCNLSKVCNMISNGEPLDSTHQLHGNRILRSGPIRIRIDDEWRNKLSFRYHLLYWIVGRPLASAIDRLIRRYVITVRRDE